MKKRIFVAAALAAAFTTAPSLAQDKGRGGERVRDRAEQESRRGGEARGRGRRDEGPSFGRRNARPVPPGWCQGRGNPHNTSANCGYHTDRIERDRDGVWKDRYGNPIEREGIYRDIEGILRDRYGRRLG